MKVEANGISMNYEITGSGDWLTLVHGAGDNLNAWYNQLTAFSRQYRVLTYDVRGHGQTELAGDYTFDVWAEDLYALLKTLKVDKTFVLGYSMGGSIAASFTLKHPEMVRGLVLSNSGGAVPMTEEATRQMAQRRQSQMDAFEKEGMLGIFKQRMTTTFSPGFAQKHPEVMEKYKAILLQNRPEGYRKVMDSMARRGPIDFARITCPTLIIVGEYDAFSGPEAGKALQKLVRGSELEVFPTGHGAPIERPEEYNKTVLAFLNKISKVK